MTLLLITQNLLKRAPRHLTMKRIATESDVPYHWLCRFHQELIYDPGVRRVQKVHDYLVRMPDAKPDRYLWSDITKRIFPEDPGVYEIFDERGDRIYVGRTNNISRRISEHSRNESIINASPSHILFTHIEDEEAIFWLENTLITAYSPPLNTIFNPAKKGWSSKLRT